MIDIRCGSDRIGVWITSKSKQTKGFGGNVSNLHFAGVSVLQVVSPYYWSLLWALSGWLIPNGGSNYLILEGGGL